MDKKIGTRLGVALIIILAATITFLVFQFREKLAPVLSPQPAMEVIQPDEEEGEEFLEEEVYEPPAPRIYPVTDGKTYRIVSIGRCPGFEDPAVLFDVEGLEVNIGGEWTEVYRPTPLAEMTLCTLSNTFVVQEESIVFSPGSDYVGFQLLGYESGKSMLINTKTKQSVINPETYVEEIFWSKDGKNYAFVSSYFRGRGEDGIWVSRYNVPDQPERIFDLSDWRDGEKYVLGDLKFLDNQHIEFAFFEEETGRQAARFRYDLKARKLTTLTILPGVQKADVCRDPAQESIGDGGYPVAEKYVSLGRLGELFTASDCGPARLQVVSQKLSFSEGVSLSLGQAPSAALLDTLRSLKFKPDAEVCAAVAESACAKWNLLEEGAPSDLLKLKPFAPEIEYADCIRCG